MAFKEIRLPEKISFGAVGGPGFLTNIVSTASGIESRNVEWSLERGEWEVSYDARIPEVYDELQAFIRVVWGRGYGFRYKDWADYQVTAVTGKILMIGGSTTIGQLYKRYTFGAETYDRKIVKPALGQGSLTFTALYKDDVQLTYGPGGGQVVFDESQGRVTFNTAPGDAVLHWVGDFDVPVRFDTDRMMTQVVNKNGRGLIKGWVGISLVELKL